MRLSPWTESTVTLLSSGITPEVIGIFLIKYGGFSPA
jgi:hypothetical protein